MATITVAEFATELHTDPRTARKFLRSVTDPENHPGKGSRWSIEKRDIRSLRSKFTKFTEAQEAAKAEKATKSDKVDGAPEDDGTYSEMDDSLDSLEGPTDEEMLAADND